MSYVQKRKDILEKLQEEGEAPLNSAQATGPGVAGLGGVQGEPGGRKNVLGLFRRKAVNE